MVIQQLLIVTKEFNTGPHSCGHCNILQSLVYDWWLLLLAGSQQSQWGSCQEVKTAITWLQDTSTAQGSPNNGSWYCRELDQSCNTESYLNQSEPAGSHPDQDHMLSCSTEAYTQESSRLTVSTKLAPDEVNGIQGEAWVGSFVAT